MANLRAIVITLFITLLLAPVESLAYDRSVHEAITQSIIDSYNTLHPSTFDSVNKQLIINGSSAEDDDSRFLNHFYDPINYRGLTEFGIALGEPSEEWAQDTRGQASWRCIAYLPCSHNLGYNDKLFSSATDYSWDRDIYEYVYGDKQRALEGLGHVLHVLEDATVPAHVRNDQHGHIGSIGDPDPYETYTSSFNYADVRALNATNFPVYPNLNSYLDHVASFTNTHFLSKDTIFKYFSLPSESAMIRQDGFLINPLGGYKVAWEKSSEDQYSGVKHTDIFIDDSSHSVLQENWDVLSKAAVLNGVGVIDLFFKKVEEEQRAGAIRAKNVSAADENMKLLASKGFGIVKALYGSSLQQSDVDDLLDEGSGGQSAAAVLATQSSPPAPAQPNQNPPAPVAASQVKNAIVAKQDTTPAKSSVPTTALAFSSSIPGARQSSTPQGSSPGYGGGGGFATQSPHEPAAPAPTSIELTIASPLDSVVFGTTSVTFSGTSSGARWVVAVVAGSSATSSIDINGNWIVTLDLPEGTTHVVFTASGSSGTDSVSVARDISVDLTPTDAAVVTVPACQFSFAVGFCALTMNSASVNWSDVPGATSYALVTSGVLGPITTATSAVAALSANATTTIAVVAYDAAGNAATSSSVFVGSISSPLVINEIGWGGTNNSSANQWIEIKNSSQYDIDLSHASLAFSDGSTALLSGTLAGGRYLVVEPHFFVMNLDPLVVPFTLSMAAAEQIRLVWNNDEGETILDSTPATDACAGWCAGSLGAKLGSNVSGLPDLYSPLSMERTAGTSDGTLASSWHSTDSYGAWLANGATMWGTPGQKNSEGWPDQGVVCDSSGPVAANQPLHIGASCIFLMRFITGNTFGPDRFAGMYRGDVGSSTGGMSFVGKPLAAEVPLGSTSDLVPGEHFFFAAVENRSWADDALTFNLYFTNGSVPAPHSNYFVIPFTYAP
jgi:hypothetical protein